MMNDLLIFCYRTNDYYLISSEDQMQFGDVEILFEFADGESQLALRVLTNLRLEHQRPDVSKPLGRVA